MLKIKKIMAILAAMAVITTAGVSMAASVSADNVDEYSTDSFGTEQADSFDDSYNCVGDNSAFPTMQSLIDSHNEANGPAKLARGLTGQRALSINISGKENYDKDSKDNSWNKELGYCRIVVSSNNIINLVLVKGIFIDNLIISNTVATYGSRTATNICEFSVSIYSGGTTKWSDDVKIGYAKNNVTSPSVTLSNNNATFACLAYYDPNGLDVYNMPITTEDK